MRPKKSLLAILFIAVLQWTFGQSTSEFFEKADGFFSTHVSDGRVNYKAIKADPSTLDALLNQAASLEVSSSEASTYQAFWINAYNSVSYTHLTLPTTSRV